MDALGDKPVAKRCLYGLTGLMALAGLPHLINLNPWVMAFFYGTLALRVLLWPDPGKRPAKLLVNLSMLLAIGLLFLTTSYSEGRLFGVALLLMMLGLKLIELKARRDLFVTVLLGYFLLVTLFLFDKGLAITVYALVLSVGFTALLVNASRKESNSPLVPTLKTAAGMSLAALPVMLLLFLFFPRLEGPLWSINLGKGGFTGMSDNISMGTISQLSQSTETAFRVQFAEGKMPAPKDRYWRGMVLRRTDGKQWHRGVARGQVMPVSLLDDPLEYELTMEPSGQPWLFPLDRLVASGVNTRISADHELSTDKPIERRMDFRLSSSVSFWLSQAETAQLEAALELPENLTDRMRQLVNSWKLKGDDRAVVQAALDHFNQLPFVYTLQPPLVTDNPVDQFMFETRRGFCEHYATSFATLMRMAGIPANVVIGYQGGEINPRGGHLIVRQSDAHAWAEVWLKNEGWVRVDPTAAVAPERIELGIDADLSGIGAVIFRGGDLGFISDLWRNAGWLRDQLDMSWHQWVVGYNKSRQDDLLSGFGLSDLAAYQKNLLAVLAAFVGITLVLLLSLRKKKSGSEIVVAYRKYITKLKRAGMDVPAHLGPSDLGRLASRRFPESGADIRAITQIYTSLRYGAVQNKEAVASLTRRVSRLRLG